MPVAALILWDYLSIDAGPDQGKRVLRRWGCMGVCGREVEWESVAQLMCMGISCEDI